MSAGMSAWTSAGYPAPKLTLWAAFSFLREGAVKGIFVSFLVPKNCDPSRHLQLQEPRGPPGPKLQKSLKKGLFGGLEKSLRKYPKKSKNTDFRAFWAFFLVFLDFFGYFSRLFSRSPKRPFLRLFCDFGPGGPGDSCKWRLGSQRAENAPGFWLPYPNLRRVQLRWASGGQSRFRAQSVGEVQKAL